MARRRVNVFGLAFLDAMTCGFGAVVLFFMVINASAGRRAGRLTHDLRAEVDRLETEVLRGQTALVELRNDTRRAERTMDSAHGLSRRLLSELAALREALASGEAGTLARRESVEQLKADLKSLEQEALRLAARAPPSAEAPGDRVRAFVGDGDRQYLTGLKVGGARIAIVVDRSASMLDETIVNVIRRRNLPAERRRQAAKWQRAVRTVDWLTTQLPAGAHVQILTFAESASPLLADAGDWLPAGDGALLERAMAALRQVTPAGGTSLVAAFEAAAALRPRPDNLILLLDGLPTLGRRPPRRGTVSGAARLKLFTAALDALPRGVPVNVVLFPMEGDPMAASAYWKLALATRGSFMSPAEDWP